MTKIKNALTPMQIATFQRCSVTSCKLVSANRKTTIAIDILLSVEDMLLLAAILLNCRELTLIRLITVFNGTSIQEKLNLKIIQRMKVKGTFSVLDTEPKKLKTAIVLKEHNAENAVIHKNNLISLHFFCIHEAK